MQANQSYPRERRDSAFSLIEMLVVMAIVGLLLAAAVPIFKILK